MARWAIRDGRRLPIADARPGERLKLSVEPFAANPQLQPLFVANTLLPNRDLVLSYEVEEQLPAMGILAGWPGDLR